jgi:hypothetical protein
MARALRVVTVAAVFLLSVPLAHALGGHDRKPGSIWAMTAMAHSIAVVSADGSSAVKSVIPQATGDYVGLDHVRVLEQLKGPHSKRLVISEMGSRFTDMIMINHTAPQPLQRFAPRAPELVFLESPVPGVSYRAPFFSGRIAPRDAAELAVFREWIARAVAIQARHAPASVPSDTVRAWILEGAARRATRAHALESFAMGSLTPQERHALLEGFAREPSTDRTFWLVLQAAEGESNETFDRAAAGVLETLLGAAAAKREEGAPTWCARALPRLMKRLGLTEQEQARITGRSDGTLVPTRASVEAAWRALKEHPRFPRAEAVPPYTSLGAVRTPRPGPGARAMSALGSDEAPLM